MDVVLKISGQSTFVAATSRYAVYGECSVDWHSLGTVDCANQIRLRKPLISNGLRSRHNRKRRGVDSPPSPVYYSLAMQLECLS